MGELEHEPLSGIEMAAPCTERRQQEQAGGGETQTDGCQGGSERPLLAISERNLLRTIHRDEVRRQQAAGITERVPQRHGRGRSEAGHFVATCYSAEEAIEVIKKYLSLNSWRMNDVMIVMGRASGKQDAIEKMVMDIPNNSILKNGEIKESKPRKK